MSQLIFAQQDLSNPDKKVNDLIVVNDQNYTESGLSVGPGGAYNNMRLSYSVTEASGSITTDRLNIVSEQLYFKNLASVANSVKKTYNYIVMDSLGNVKQGYPHYQGDINTDIGTIKADIISLKENVGLPVVKPISMETIMTYISTGCNILFLIIIIILIWYLIKVTRQVKKITPKPLTVRPSVAPSIFQPMAQPLQTQGAFNYSQPTFQQPMFQQPSFQQPTFQQPAAQMSSTPSSPSLLTSGPMSFTSNSSGGGTSSKLSSSSSSPNLSKPQFSGNMFANTLSPFTTSLLSNSLSSILSKSQE